MKEKSIVALIFILTLIFAITSCSNGNIDSTAETELSEPGERTNQSLYISIPNSGDDIPSLQDYKKIAKAVELYRIRYPEVDVKVNLSLTTEDIKKKMMAGDDDLGVFINYYFDFYSHGRNNTLVDLKEYPSILKKLENVFDGLINLCEYNGKMLGVPYDYSFTTLYVNSDLYGKLNFELPKDIWSWEDFYSYAFKAQQDMDGNGHKDTCIISCEKRDAPFISQMLAGYMDMDKGSADLSNEKIKSTLALWKKMWDEDLIEEGRIMSKKDHVLLSLGKIGPFSGNSHFVYMPVIDKNDPKFGLRNFEILSIPKSSSGIEQAVDFLEIFLSEDVQKQDINAPLFKDISIYESWDSYQNFLHNLDKGTDEFGLSNDANYNLFNQIMNLSRIELPPVDLRLFIMDTMEKYINGEISLDDFILQMDGKAKMIAGE